MIPLLICVVLLVLMLLGGIVWASGAEMPRIPQGSGIIEAIPDALETRNPTQTAWAFMAGFGLMVLVQAVL